MNNFFEHVKAFFLKLFTVIFAFFNSILSVKNSPKEKKKIEEIKKEEIIKKEDVIVGTTPTSMPDEPSTLTNPHNETSGDEEKPNAVILKLPKFKKEVIKYKAINSKKFLITEELIDELIDKAIEEIEEYKEIDFKVKDADKETKEIIKEFKEKIIPKINHQIERNKPENPLELSKIVTEVVKEEHKKEPILPKKNEEIKLDLNNDKKEDIKLDLSTKKKEPYFMATVIPNNTLNLKSPAPVKEDTKIAKTVPEVKDEIKDKADDVPIRMVQNTKDILNPSPKEEIKTIATVAAITVVKAIDTVLTSVPKEKKEKIKKAPPVVEVPLPKEEPKKEEVIEQTKEEPKEEKVKELDLPELKKVDEKIKESNEPKEMEVVSEELVYIDTKIEDKKEEIQKEEELPKKEEIKEEPKKEEPVLIKEELLTNISLAVDAITKKANEEIKKEDIEDKEYNKVYDEIDEILQEIDETMYKYRHKLPIIQLRKLEAQRAKIEKTKYSIDAQQKIDINNERQHLNEVISESERKGLKEEINRRNMEHTMELNNKLLGKLDKLDNVSQEQIAAIEKEIVKNRLREAYRHATITSMIAFPFVRTKFFFYFTAGMMVKTFLMQIEHVFNRRRDRLTTPDIIELRNGENALNEAINTTEENMDTLEYLTSEAIARYPELQFDQEYVKYVKGLRERLNNNYNKLTKKRNIISHTLYRSKKDVKQLKKIRKKDLDNAA